MQKLIQTENLELYIREGFDDEPYFEKGYFVGVELRSGGCVYELSFFDPYRLNQDVLLEVGDEGFFFEKNMIAIKSITLDNIKAAALWLVKSGLSEDLCPRKA